MVFSALLEGYGVLVAGVSTDSINVSVTVLDVISLSSPDDVALTPDILGVGTAEGSVTWNVSNNAGADWEFELESESTPALASNTSSIADYLETNMNIPEFWNVSSNESEFRFSVSGNTSELKYANGTKFEGFSGSSKIKVASGTGALPAEGENITVHFKVEVGSSYLQEAGKYSAKVIATVATL